jgi:hypothetical protein
VRKSKKFYQLLADMSGNLQINGLTALKALLIYDGPDSKRIILAQTALNMYSSRRWMTEFALECRENRLSAKKGKVLMQL